MRSADSGLEDTRKVLHRVAAHVLARRRWDASGRLGLRVSPGGISTPAFGPQGECVRTAGTMLVREAGGNAAFTSVAGSSLRALAKFVGADIDSSFSCGDETPEIGDPDEPLHLAAEQVDVLASWYQLGWKVLDMVLGELPESARPSMLQLWPEHFDIGTSVALPARDGANLGCSPGDGHVAEPYLYVGPWGDTRPGDPGYWNVPFGAALRASELLASAEPTERAAQFLRVGLDALHGPVSSR